MSRLLAVLGDPIEHSLSPRMHQAAIHALGLDAVYEKIRLPANELQHFPELQKKYSGFNITLPLKPLLYPFAHELSPEVLKIKAANTLYLRQGQWIAANTDIAGFKKAMLEMGETGTQDIALVFGAGGAALAVLEALSQLQLKKIFLCNRSLDRAQKIRRLWENTNIEIIPWESEKIQAAMEKSRWIINSSPLGLENPLSPVPDTSFFNETHRVIDLVYGRKTLFLEQAKTQKAKTQDGLPMLLYQGALSFEYFFEQPAPLPVMRAALA